MKRFYLAVSKDDLIKIAIANFDPEQAHHTYDFLHFIAGHWRTQKEFCLPTGAKVYHMSDTCAKKGKKGSWMISGYDYDGEDLAPYTTYGTKVYF
jgi:hypothetical protein